MAVGNVGCMVAVEAFPERGRPRIAAAVDVVEAGRAERSRPAAVVGVEAAPAERGRPVGLVDVEATRFERRRSAGVVEPPRTERGGASIAAAAVVEAVQGSERGRSSISPAAVVEAAQGSERRIAPGVEVVGLGIGAAVVVLT